MIKHLVLKPLNIAISTALIASTIGLTACGGDSDDHGGNVTTEGNNTPTQQALGSYSLVKAETDDKFLKYYSSALNNSQSHLEIDMDGNSPVANSAEDSSTGANTDKQSSTNLIEAGVDEVDYVKQNATHIYTAVNSYGDKHGDIIQVFAKPSTDSIAQLDLGKSFGLKGFFLKENNLYNFRQISYGGIDWEAESSGHIYNNGVIALQTIDVANPNAPALAKTYQWQGDYVDSRRIDDKVYVVSSSQLNDPWMCYDDMPMMMPDVALEDGVTASAAMPYCGQQKELTTEHIIERMPIDINGSKVKPTDCYIPNEYNKDSNNINMNITLITEVDLKNSDNNKTTCISASAESFYMSPDALYLAGQNYTNDDGEYRDKTIISKFGLESDKVTYAGSGAVDGHINWDTASFSMSEYNDVLRVVTTMSQDNQITNMLHTLKESETKLMLDTLATLPNKNQPASLGKPNERIKGVRFLGDEGYVVTFENQDPLYKIDLADPSHPKIVGELELPGYSAYLHRINDKYLLGVGYTTDDKSRADGMQVTVFDTSGDNPVIVAQDSIDTGDSAWLNLAVDSDSRAITTLMDGNTMQLSIPYSIVNYGANYQMDNKAVEYNIDVSTGLLSHKIERDNDVLNTNYSQNILRSLISNDDIYYSVDGDLNKYTWGVQ